MFEKANVKKLFLKFIPGILLLCLGMIPVSTLSAVAVLQAEDASYDDAVVESEYTGYTGTGYVNTTNASGTYIEWTYSVSATANAQCLCYFANGSDNARPMELRVNGNVVVSSLDFPSTGDWAAWDNVSAVFVLNAGSNTIRLTSLTSEGAPNLDKIELALSGGAETRGDVNGDGSVTIVDALMIAQYYVGLDPQGFDTAAGDVNCDDSINILDALMTAQFYVGLIAGFTGCPTNAPTAVPTAVPTAPPTNPPQGEPPRIELANAPAPLFDDPVWHGASDPFVVWNAARGEYFMYYTQRRATLSNPDGVNWVHGSAIGIATSANGTDWSYLGTCQGDNYLGNPLEADGNGPYPGITWWAPGYVYDGSVLHMFVTRVDGVYTDWTGTRNIVHFTSNDGVNFTYRGTCSLSSNRVIDPTVYKVNNTWYMVYKDEAAGSRIYRSESSDMNNWSNATQVISDSSQEAPFVFHWQNSYWLIDDWVSGDGLRIYKSSNGISQWSYITAVLAAADGVRPLDDAVGHHPGILLQEAAGGGEQCILFYFTHQGNQTVMQVAELEMGSNGVPFCDRNKYAY